MMTEHEELGPIVDELLRRMRSDEPGLEQGELARLRWAMKQVGVISMSAQSDPSAKATAYRKALIDICNFALKIQCAEPSALVPAPVPTQGETHDTHAMCHDLACNGDRAMPRGAKGFGCSCLSRAKRESASPPVAESYPESVLRDLETRIFYVETGLQALVAAARFYRQEAAASPPVVGWQPTLTSLRLRNAQTGDTFVITADDNEMSQARVWIPSGAYQIESLPAPPATGTEPTT